MAAEAHPTAATIHRLDGPMPDPALGVFETTLVVDGRAVALDAHLTRLESSLDALYGQRAPDQAHRLVTDAAADAALGRLRLTVAPGSDGAAATASVRVAAVDRTLVFPGWERAVELAPVTVPGGIGAHKWADRRLLERAESEAAPAVPLIVDSDGAALEGSRGSLFLVRGGTVSTPPTDGRLLPGITRAQAIEAARGLGLEVREEAVELGALADADEVFLTGAVRGVEPVRRCIGVREWDPGRVTERIAAELRRVWLG
jgi:para-aminobenzoate synthetase / 4-amino-4-deoxychorismate lyase